MAIKGRLFSYFSWFQLVLLLFGFLAWLAGTQLSLWDQDEAAYAGFAMEMLRRPDWLIPDFPWSDIHRKPPLHFWSIACSFWLFTYTELAVRLPAILAMLGTFLLIRYRAGTVFGAGVAKRAAWILAANFLLVFITKISVTDSLLLFFETMAALALVNFMQQPDKREYAWFVVGVAGGLLVKGPPVLILTLGMMGCILLFHPQRWRLLRFHPWFLFPLAAIPLLYWGSLAWQRDEGAFISWMLDWYTFGRVSKAVLGQTGPPGYYLAFILISFLPFLLVLPAAFRSLLQPLSPLKWQPKQVLLLGWLASGWLIYELMTSKLPAYAIGAYPAIALLLSAEWEKLTAISISRSKIHRFGLGLYALLVVALVLLLLLAPHLDRVLIRLVGGQALWPFYLVAGLFLTMGAWAVVLLLRANFSRAFSVLLLQAFVLLLGVFWGVMPMIEEQRSATKTAAMWVVAQGNYTKLVAAKNYRLPSLPFYVLREGLAFETAASPAACLQALEEPEAALLIQAQDLEELLPAIEAAGHSTTPRQIIPGFISDKGKFVDWYVF